MWETDPRTIPLFGRERGCEGWCAIGSAPGQDRDRRTALKPAVAIPKAKIAHGRCAGMRSQSGTQDAQKVGRQVPEGWIRPIPWGGVGYLDVGGKPIRHDGGHGRCERS